MADTRESTGAKLKGVTSPTAASRQPSTVKMNTSDGVKLPMDERDEIITVLARLLDVMNSWPCKIDGKLPRPFVTSGHVMFALPKSDHVIKNTITSEGGMNFSVDDVMVIPVTSDADNA